MSLFTCILADVIHIVKVLVLCDMFFSFRRRDIWHNGVLLAAMGIVMSGVSAFIHLYDNDIIEMLIYVVAVTLLIFLLYREQLKRVLISVLWMIYTLAMIDIMVGVLVDIFMNLLGISGETLVPLCVSLLSLFIVYIVGKIYWKNAAAGINSIGISNLLWFTLLMFIDAAVISVVGFVNTDLILEEHRDVYSITVVLVIIGIFIQLTAVILLFMQRNIYKEKKQLMEKYLNEQKNHYEYLEKRETETKKFRHDFRSHLELISNLARNQEYDEIQKYLEKLHIKIDELGNIVTVHNGIIDAIINLYYAKALQSGIKMEVKGRLPDNYDMDAYDACTIFSNVLSNAIEAAQETEEKYVALECRYNERSIFIVVRNSFSKKQKHIKKNPDYHGYGLENVKECIHKNKGVFDIEIQGDIFSLTILLSCTEN